MKVEFLEEDELLVELEIRGLVEPLTGVVTPELKEALAGKIKAERDEDYFGYSDPRNPHKAALKYPECEVAICQQKLLAVQKFLLEGIRTGKTVAEMTQWLITKMEHLGGRISRRNQFNTKLVVLFRLVDDLVRALLTRVSSPSDVATKLSRIVIKANKPVNEELELGKQIGERVEDTTKTDLNVYMESVTGYGKANPKEDVGNVKIKIEMKVKEEIGEHEGEATSEPTGDSCASAKEISRDTGVRGSGAHDSQSRQDGGTRARFRGLYCARLMARVLAWCEWGVAQWRIPVARRWWVLDLRLEDEVLAKAQRKISYEDV